MKPMRIVVGAIALTLAAAAAPMLTSTQAIAAPAAADAPAAPKLHAAMRALWQGHAETTREYALAVKAGDAAAEKKAADAVVANAKQIADAVAQFLRRAGRQEDVRAAGRALGRRQGADRRREIRRLCRDLEGDAGSRREC